MSKIGEILRKKRESQEITIEEAANQTMISRKYIEGFESDNREIFPGPVYAKGFLRNYAEYLCFDKDEVKDILEQFAYEWQGKEESPASIPESVQSEGAKNILYTYAAIVIFVIIAALFLISPFKKGEKKLLSIDPSKLLEEADISPDKGGRQKPLPVETEGKLKMVLERVAIEVFATEKVWLQALIDDTKRAEVNLNPNQRVSWVGREKIFLTISNAGGAVFKLNGKYIGSLGKSGEVKRLTITSKGIEMKVLETRNLEPPPSPKESAVYEQPQAEPAPTGTQSIIKNSLPQVKPPEPPSPPQEAGPEKETNTEQP